ncbi:MAG: ATP-dependent DNA helicase [Thermoplasmatales archaeon]
MSGSAFDAFQFADPIVQNTKDKFRPSLVKLAEKRLPFVKQIDKYNYIVMGSSKFHDEYDEYIVALNPTTNKYTCSCYGHYMGQSRQSRICSHVLACILYRKQNKQKANGAEIPGPQDPMFGYPPLPSKFTCFREHQWKAIHDIVEAFSDGFKWVILEAPTGSGKTLIAEAVRRLLHKQMTYTCTTIMLQEQFMRDFGSYAHLIKGRSNYPTYTYPNLFRDGVTNLSAADCMGSRYVTCPYCIDLKTGLSMENLCPYKIAKRQAREAQVLVTNSAYFLYDANFSGSSICRESKFVVLDECDMIESKLMDFVSFSISNSKIAKYDLKLPAKKTIEQSWIEWIDDYAINKFSKIKSELIRARNNMVVGSREFIRAMREVKWLDQTISKLKMISPEMAEGNWVYTGYKENNIEFKPITVSKYAPDILWAYGEQFLCMSGTIVSAQQYAEDLNIPKDDYKFINVDYSFPKENRPVFAVPVANMTHKTESEETPKLIAGIIKILHKYPDKRVLIHTVSARLANAVISGLNKADLKRPIIGYNDSDTKMIALGEYKKHNNSVIVAYSFDRGVDLPEDLCSCIIICKMPFASLGDKQVSRRLYSKGGSIWYTVNCIRTTIQQCGRGVRHENDKCDSWIIDTQFITNIWKKSKHLIPRWWRDAVLFNKSLNMED